MNNNRAYIICGVAIICLVGCSEPSEPIVDEYEVSLGPGESLYTDYMFDVVLLGSVVLPNGTATDRAGVEVSLVHNEGTQFESDEDSVITKSDGSFELKTQIPALSKIVNPNDQEKVFSIRPSVFSSFSLRFSKSDYGEQKIEFSKLPIKDVTEDLQVIELGPIQISNVSE